MVAVQKGIPRRCGVEQSMSVLLVIVGFAIARFGAHLHLATAASRSKPLLAELLILCVQAGGWSLVVWGIVRFFN